MTRIDTPAPLINRMDWLLPLLALAISIVAGGYLVMLETTVRVAKPLQIDELYFLTCAVRAVAHESGVSSGCHDNKGPLIHFLYVLGVEKSNLFDLTWMKHWGAAVYALNTLLVGLISWLLAGRAAAIVSAVACIGVLMLAPEFMALKTESLAIFFTLCASVILIRQRLRPGRVLQCGAVGVLMGLSLLANQKFVVVLAALLICLAFWVWQIESDSFAKKLRALSLAIGAVLIGVLLPFLLVAAYFAFHARFQEFVAAMVLYPSLYGSQTEGSLLQLVAWQVGHIADRLRPFMIYAIALGCLLVWLGCRFSGWFSGKGLQADGLDVVALSAVLFTALCFGFTILFSYHFLPAFMYAAVAIGVGYAALMRALPTTSGRASVGFAVVVFSAIQGLAMWKSADRRNSGPDPFSYYRVPGLATHAFVVGQWPAFYAFNNLIPASDVLYPQALRGVRAGGFYRPPAPGSLKAELLDRFRSLNEEKILGDFSKTPPTYIYVIDWVAKVATEEASNLPLINGYVSKHCKFEARVEGQDPLYIGSLYYCRQ